MGQVFLARDLTAMDRVVALKLLLPEFLDATADFMREYVLQRRLRHPAVPRVHDFGFGAHPMGEVPYFVMDYVRGVPLARAMHGLDRLDRAWPWILETLRALDHLHGLGYLHRDLKPSNILVDVHGDRDPAAHLIDFGIAIPIEAEPEELFIGTPEYSAPELMAGDPFDVRQDLYAVGLLLYEIVAGRRPWPQEDPTALWEARTYGRHPAILRKDCPPGLIRLIDDLLAPNPDDRPSSAAELIEAFSAIVGVEPVIETAEAFRLRLDAYPLCPPAELERAAREWHSGLRAEFDDSDGRPAILVLDTPAGLDGQRQLGELTDRGAVGGARSVRVALDGPVERPLAGVGRALDLFRRLRVQRANGRPVVDLPGLAGAATMLTRLHDPTVLSIDGLQRCDALSLELLATVFTGAANSRLRVVATMDPDEAPVAPRAFHALLNAKFTHRVPARYIQREDLVSWLDDVLGPGLVSPERLDVLLERSERRPDHLRALLAEEYGQGRVVRVADGYVLKPGFALPPEARRPTTGIDRADLLACLIHAFPAEVVQRYLQAGGDELAELVADGILLRQGGELLAARPTQVSRERYRALDRQRRHHLHRRLAQSIAAAARYPGQAAACAREWSRSAQPLQAAPWHVVAANEAADRLDVEGAEDHFSRAVNLLDAHAVGVDESKLLALRIQVARTALRLGRMIGLVERWSDAATELFEMGAGQGNVGLMAEGIEALMDLDAEARDWDALMRHAEARRSLPSGGGARDGEALHAWAEACVAWSDGRSDVALQLLESAAEHELSRRVRLRLARLSAEIVTLTQREVSVAGTLERHRALAEEAGDPTERALASLFAASHAREHGELATALERLDEAAEAAGEHHLRRVSGRVELERARCHLAIGWWATALDHADRGRALAERDGDVETALAARTVEACGVAALGQVDEALGLLDEVDEDLHEQASSELRALIGYARLETELAATDGPPCEGLVGRARRLAVKATKARLRAWAVRAWSLAARAALGAGDPSGAFDFVDGALDLSERWGAVGPPLHQLLYLLARTQLACGDPSAAAQSLVDAQRALETSAAAMPAQDQRRTWLTRPDHARVSLGDLIARGPLSRPLPQMVRQHLLQQAAREAS